MRPILPGRDVEDITARKRAEESLRVSEEKFATAFYGNTAAMALTSLDDGCVLEVNDAGEGVSAALLRTARKLRDGVVFA